MTNEEKAQDISLQWWSDCGWQLQAAAYDSAIEAMQWKDEEHAQEKQQWIDKACEWLKDNEYGFETANEAIIAFKKAMKGG